LEHDSVSDTTIDMPPVRPVASSSQPASVAVQVEIAGTSHAGRVRPNNEDSYLVAQADRSLEVLETNLPEGEVPTWAAERSYGLIVADGMGGQAAGEVASRLALKAVLEHVLTTSDWIMRDPKSHTERIEQRMTERIARADEIVHEEASRNPRWAGMGATLTLAVSSGGSLFLGHVGDSRAYLLRGGQLHRLTHDHSLAQALADTGVIGQEEVATHQLRNMLLRSLGAGNAQADVRHVTLKSGDQLLLCTDGLTDMVPDDQISALLASAPTSRAACHSLLTAALTAGGKDNVTVVVAKYQW
jgi:serine/threonine protein phosphatase PrpC